MADLSREQIEGYRATGMYPAGMDGATFRRLISDMALTALSDSVRVPREPTEEMIRAAKSVWGISALNLREIWKAMLAASDKEAR